MDRNLEIIPSQSPDLKDHLIRNSLFIIARTWKQPRCPSADEWIRKLWDIYTMEYYSAIKKNTFGQSLKKGLDEDIRSPPSWLGSHPENH